MRAASKGVTSSNPQPDDSVASALLAQVVQCGDYLTTSPSRLCPSGLWLLIPLTTPLAEAIEAAGEDLPEDDEPDEVDGDDEPSDGTEDFLPPAAGHAPDWHPWTLLPSEVA